MESPGARLRALLAGETILVPGAYNALVGRVLEDAGFPAIYAGGYASAGRGGGSAVRRRGFRW